MTFESEASAAFGELEGRFSNGAEEVAQGACPEAVLPLKPLLTMDAVRQHVAGLFDSEGSGTADQKQKIIAHIPGIQILTKTVNQVIALQKIEQSVHPRPATIDDIPAMVGVDWRAFRRVHADSGLSEAEIRANQTRNFTNRFSKVGSKWIEVLEVDDKVSGFIMACPTSKPPASFTSWEDTTDNGTLETTYDPDGEYLYVVSLATVPQASKVGGQDMLMGRMIAKIVAHNKQAYFESRMPGFLRWVKNRREADATKVDGELDRSTLDQYAQEYVELKITLQGQEVPADPLLREYEKMGCKFVKVYAEAYQDSRSLNYGVLCTFDSPLPEFAKRNRALRTLAGKVISTAAASPLLVRKFL